MSESDEKFIFRSVADVISRMHLMGADEANDIILDLKRNQRKRNADVDKLMSFYFTADGCIDFESMRKWLSYHGDIDELFIVRVIEVAGRMTKDKSVSGHTSTAGKIGAKKKHEHSNAFKDWAMDAAADLRKINPRLNDTDVAEKLIKKVPDDLASRIRHLKNPERVICAALSKQRKAEK